MKNRLFEIVQISGNLAKEVEIVKQATEVAMTTGTTPKEFKARIRAKKTIADASPAAKILSKRIVAPR